ncbi:hypothetical protein ACFOGJ_12860 [Marinibaculum pumilum]|uniref:Uncharacterized protein n=1 Tax=Marinibaculum pumilum TaxID=1766165 RepID=A0ABV7L128_9PROT
MTEWTPGPGSKAKGRRPSFAPDPNTDRLVSMLMALAGEVWVLRERLDTAERLLADSGALPAGAIDAFRPAPDLAAEREAARAAYLDRILWIVSAAKAESEGGETADSYQDVVDALAGRD